MKLISASPGITEIDVNLMMKRTGVKDDDITKLVGGEWVLSVRQRGSYTVAMITKTAFPIAIGVSKRMMEDRDNPIIGGRQALRRCFTEVNMLLDKKVRKEKVNERLEESTPIAK